MILEGFPPAGGAATAPLALFLVFACAKLMAELCERIGQPGIVGEIAAGVILGPAALNWVAPSELLAALADLGAMFLLFRAGLEVRAAGLLKSGATAMAVAALGVAVPQLLGWGIMAAVGYGQIEALFVGAAMVATSVGITAQVLSAKRLLHLASSQIILAAAVIDDVFGLLVLAAVSSMARGHIDFAGIAATTVLAGGFVVIAAKWGGGMMSRIAPRLRQSLRMQEAEFSFALILLFGFSLLAVYSGVAAIVGAFLAGMAMSETAGRRVKDLAHGATELLVPFFLAGIGLRVDLAPFANPATLGLFLAILAAAVVSKLIGCGLGAIRLGRKEMLRIGVGMTPRGEVGMVVAQLGLAMGAISKPVYGIVVGMAVATTMIAPLLLNFAYRGEEPMPPGEEEFRNRLK